jgi:transcriptional regulator GlxA family with amidase domain
MTRYFYADDEYENYLEECESMNTAHDLEVHLDWLEETADETATVRELAEKTGREVRYFEKLEV